MLVLRRPYLLYLGDAVLKSDCKTAFGLRDWCGQDVIGEWSHPAAKVSLGLPRLSPVDAARQGAGSIIVGVAPTGGVLPDHWQEDLEAALSDAGVESDLADSIVDENAAARIDGLRAALGAMAVLGVLAILATRRLPTEPVGGASGAHEPDPALST